MRYWLIKKLAMNEPIMINCVLRIKGNVNVQPRGLMWVARPYEIAKEYGGPWEHGLIDNNVFIGQ